MSGFINFDQICQDLKNAVDGAADKLGFGTTFVDANDRDFVIQNYPLLDIRVKRMDTEPATNATYYSDVTLEAEIVAHSMTNRAEAAKLRYDLLNALCAYVKGNPRFSADLETTVLGQANFVTGESKSDGAFVAGVVLELHPRIYSE